MVKKLETGIRFEHVSKYIKELMNLGYVTNLTPEKTKGKVFGISESGTAILAEIKEKKIPVGYHQPSLNKLFYFAATPSSIHTPSSQLGGQIAHPYGTSRVRPFRVRNLEIGAKTGAWLRRKAWRDRN